MEFKSNQTIYMQIADFICENILKGKWEEGNKMSSVREMAATIEVNPNTVMRTYSYLQDAGIISNKRGIGFFINEGASQKIEAMQKEEFITKILPEIFRKMELLNIDMDELKSIYDQSRQN